MTDPYKVYQQTTPDDLIITKKGTKWTIRNDQNQYIWIVGNGTIRNQLCKSSYKEDSNFIAFSLNMESETLVSRLQSNIQTTLSEKVCSKTIENVRIPKEIAMKQSITDSVIYINTDINEIVCFDYNKEELQDIHDTETFNARFQVDAEVSFILEPSFCWFMNHQFGIHWKLVQILLKKKSEIRSLPFSMELDEDEI